MDKDKIETKLQELNEEMFRKTMWNTNYSNPFKSGWIEALKWVMQLAQEDKPTTYLADGSGKLFTYKPPDLSLYDGMRVEKAKADDKTAIIANLILELAMAVHDAGYPECVSGENRYGDGCHQVGCKLTGYCSQLAKLKE